MSALTLMSVIAPSIPGVPQGSSGEAATGFQDLLTALSDEAGAGRSARAGGAEASTPIEAKAGTEAETPALTGLLVAPTPAPVPVTPPAVGETATAAEPGLIANAGGERKMDAAPASPAAALATDDPDVPATTTPVPVGKGLTAKTNEPQVLPFVADVVPLRGASTEVRPTVVTMARSAPAPAAVEARAPAAVPSTTALPPTPMAEDAPAPATTTATPPAPAPTPTTVPGQVPAPALTSAPPPLRPLADRTSRPSDATPAREVDGQRPNEAARPAAAAAAAAAPARGADLPARPVDFAAIVARESAGADGEDATAEALPAGEAATVQTQAPTAARENVVSQLSRATVEATAQIAAQILRRLEGRSTRFEMALTPDELGRVDVKLDIDSEGRLNARLAFDNPAAATDLRGRADELRRQLEDAGFHLAADAFEFTDRDSGSSAFDRGQDARNGSSRAFASASRLNAEIDVAQPPRWMALSLSPSGVDMKV